MQEQPEGQWKKQLRPREPLEQPLVNLEEGPELMEDDVFTSERRL